MAKHKIHFILNDVPEPFPAVQTQDDPDAILRAFRAHIKSGTPEFIDVNALDSRGAYTDTIVVRLSSVASVRVNRGASPEGFNLSVTTSTVKAASPKKKTVKKAARKKKT